MNTLEFIGTLLLLPPIFVFGAYAGIKAARFFVQNIILSLTIMAVLGIILVTIGANARTGVITLNISPESTQPPAYVATTLQCSKITATWAKASDVGILYDKTYYLTDFKDIDKLSDVISKKCSK